MMTYKEISSKLETIVNDYQSDDPAKINSARADMNKLLSDMEVAKFDTTEEFEAAFFSDEAITL